MKHVKNISHTSYISIGKYPKKQCKQCNGYSYDHYCIIIHYYNHLEDSFNFACSICINRFNNIKYHSGHTGRGLYFYNLLTVIGNLKGIRIKMI